MKKKNNIRISIGDLIPVIAFVVVFLFFTIASKGKMLTAFNMKMILTQSMQVIILGSGMLFVVAQGSYAENFFTSFSLKVEYAE